MLVPGIALISYQNPAFPFTPSPTSGYSEMRDLPDCRVKQQSMHRCEDGASHRKTVFLKDGWDVDAAAKCLSYKEIII